jgi:ferritin-like metal-binding protein YciE
MTEDELKSFLRETRINLNKIEQESRMDETEDSIETLSQFFDNIKNKKSKSSKTKKIQPESYNFIPNLGNNKEEENNQNEIKDNEMLELEKAIEHYNISRTIINNLMNKKLKDHSQYYWIRKGIEPSLITRLTHKRDGMNTKTIIEALKKMKE